jgi:hypothetical protein
MDTLTTLLILLMAILAAIAGLAEPVLGLLWLIINYLRKLFRGPVKVEPYDDALPTRRK